MATKTQIGFSIYMNGKLLREVTFDRPIINVGKLSTSNLRLDDINVSRKHAVIEQRENGQWRITDLGSTNGTVIRGERVVQADLKDNERLILGTTTLLVHLDETTVEEVAKKEVAATVKKGVAGDRVRVARKEPSKPDEIRGLGQDSFYKKRQVDDGSKLILEVALLWGETVLAVEDYRQPKTITVGEAPGCRFTIPAETLGVENYNLVEARGGKFALNLSNSRIKGDVLVGGDVKTFDDLRKSPDMSGDFYLIDGPMRARLKCGEFTLLVSHGEVPDKIVTNPLTNVDYNGLIYIAISAIVHIAFLVILSLMPEDYLRSQRDPRLARERAMRVLRVEPEKEEEKEEEKKPEDPEEDPNAEKSKDAKEEEKLKVAETEIEVEVPQPKRLELVDKLRDKRKETERKEWDALSEEEKQAKAKEMARETLTEVGLQNNPLMTELMANNPDLINNQPRFRALGAQAADGQPADFQGGGMIDPFGGTFGGNDGGFQTVGSPGGTPGGNPGGPAIAGVLGKDRGTRLNDLRFRERPVTPKILPQRPRLTGELDAATVRKYIRRYLSGIKWCYQDRLQQNRKLKGKLTLAFTILGNGKTLDPRVINSNLGDSQLEGCIAQRMRRWKFPQPKDGGLVEVKYPLILKSN